MPFLASVIVPALLLEDDNLGRPRLLDHGGADRSAIEQRSAGRNLGAFADHQHLTELDRGAWLDRQSLHCDDIVLGDLVLLAAGANDCEHDTRRYGFPRVGRHGRADTGVHRTGVPRRELRNISAPVRLSIMRGLHRLSPDPIMTLWPISSSAIRKAIMILRSGSARSWRRSATPRTSTNGRSKAARTSTPGWRPASTRPITCSASSRKSI